MHGRASQWLPVICHGTEGGGSCVTSYVYSDWRVVELNPNAPAHITHEAILLLPVRHRHRSDARPAALLRMLPALFVLLAGPFHLADAQSTTSLQTDATVLPRRSFDVQLLSSWT